MKDYKEALLREIEARKGFFHTSTRPSTLYFGGGTPSSLPPEYLAAVAYAIRDAFGITQFDEFTIEANPDDVSPEKLEAWLAMGADRLSMGVQSFNDTHLRWMRRRHDAKGAVTAFNAAREAGFRNISIDLIFGYASLETGEWDETVRTAVSLNPEHISCYQMSVEEGSALGELVRRGEYAEPPQEKCAAQYELLQNLLAGAGYRQYEISNFARPGFESRHNSSYWDRSPYLGLGAAAHSFDGFRTRRWNVADMDRYISCLASGDADGLYEGETLSERETVEETIMLGLRRACGFDAASLPELYGKAVLDRAGVLARRGLLHLDGTRISIPARRLFISDSIISDLFDATSKKID